MNLSDHIAPPEIEQIRADLERERWADALREDAEDRRFRRKAWTVLAAFWIVIGAVVWMVWL